MHVNMETTTIAMEEKRIPPLLKAFGKNMIPVPTKALSSVKKALICPASPGFLAFELLRRRRRGVLSPPAAWASSSSPDSTAMSSSDSYRSSPAKPPYRSRNATKFLVTGAVTLSSRPRCCWINWRRNPPGARCSTAENVPL